MIGGSSIFTPLVLLFCCFVVSCLTETATKPWVQIQPYLLATGAALVVVLGVVGYQVRVRVRVGIQFVGGIVAVVWHVIGTNLLRGFVISFATCVDC